MKIPFADDEKNVREVLAEERRHLACMEGTHAMVGNSEAMAVVHRLIERVAPTDSTVVILGETGSGKELAAREVHEKSKRNTKPFVAVNCGALPESLIESELFGHRKGSFTGADTNRTGLLEVADGGTLFLDEIGELPKAVQAKLLRFLESGEVRKIGENSVTVCDVRVVCATLRNLETMVKAGDFREDLWFRINTLEIHLPPLRERCDDIPDLISHLAVRFRPETASLKLHELLTAEAFQKLQCYDWPGNVRQLANVIEHALILSDGFPMGVDALPPTLNRKTVTETSLSVPAGGAVAKPVRPVISKAVYTKIEDSVAENRNVETKNLPPLTGSMADLMSFEPGLEDEPTTLRDLEMKAIESALQRHDGNKTKAAEELGISLKTLYNKLNQSDKHTA